MRIDAITTCVGEFYVQHLNNNLPTWYKTLDSLTIMTNAKSVSDLNNLVSEYGPKLKVIETNAFGPFFNKGKALNEGFKYIDSKYRLEWVLSFDCDIYPPDHWRGVAERRANRLFLNGVVRFSEAKRKLEPIFIPKGYFQLWHVESPNYNREQPFIEWCEHAGRCDTLFRKQWEKKWYNNLGFFVVHKGQHSRNWYGPGTTKEQMQQAFADARQNREE